MGHENTGEGDKLVLLKYYIPLRSTTLRRNIAFFSRSIPEWVDMKGLMDFLEYPGFCV